LWKDIDGNQNPQENHIVPRSRFDELISLAEENDGLVTADHARQAGFTDSVLARLVQRGRIERTSRGVYRVPYLAPGRFSQYREAVLWARANRGPEQVAISHTTALAAYEISDANPHTVHITVPKTARLRRQKPKWYRGASRRSLSRRHHDPRGNAPHYNRPDCRGPSQVRRAHRPDPAGYLRRAPGRIHSGVRGEATEATSIRGAECVASGDRRA